MKTGTMQKTVFAAATALLLCLSAEAVWAANADVVRLGVMKFSSKAAGVSDAQAGIITDIFTRALTNSKTIAVLEREWLDVIAGEIRRGMTGLVDMNLAGCQYMLLGSVTELSEKVSGGSIPIGGIWISGRLHEAKATIDIDGSSMGSEKINVAVLKVTDVQSGYSVGDVVPDGGNPSLVRRGQKIEPISKEKAKDLSKRKAFARELPRSGGTFDQIFREDGTSAETPRASAGVPFPAATPARGPAAPAAPQKTVKGFDPNGSTDAKVIETYPLSSGEANILGVRQRNAYNKYRSGRYKDAYAEFSAAAAEYEGHYLAAYWAGRTAQSLRKKDDARAWFDRALAINPRYKPALEAREKIR